MTWPGLVITSAVMAVIIWLATMPERRQRRAHRRDGAERLGRDIAAALHAEADEMMAVADATREPPVTGQHSCGCQFTYLPYGEALVQPCRHHLYMRSPDFAAWAAEFGDRR